MMLGMTEPTGVTEPIATTEPTGRIAWITIAPVKSMALVPLERAIVDRAGISGDRAFAVLDPNCRLVNGKRIGRLATVRPTYDPVAGRLTLRFLDGTDVTGVVELGERLEGSFHGEPRPVRSVIGPWSEAISDWAGQPLRLVAPDGSGEGLDRGPTVTLLSTVALADLAAAGGEADPLDGRRFRMTFGIDGVGAYAEDAWIEHDVRVGRAVIRPIGNVGRCAVTTQDPDTGLPTFDTLGILKRLRGDLDTTEPLACGIYAEIIEAGEVRLGDPIGPV